MSEISIVITTLMVLWNLPNFIDDFYDFLMHDRYIKKNGNGISKAHSLKYQQLHEQVERYSKQLDDSKIANQELYKKIEMLKEKNKLLMDLIKELNPSLASEMNKNEK